LAAAAICVAVEGDNVRQGRPDPGQSNLIADLERPGVTL
jgi:hypothetical protein